MISAMMEASLRTDTAIEVSSAELRRCTEDGVEVICGKDVRVEIIERVEILARRESREVWCPFN
jgi:hypothetical protein